MRKNIWVTLILPVLFITSIFCQENNTSINFIEGIPDSTKFNMHLDSIYKYSYHNHQKLKYHIDECQALFSKGLKISKKDELDYAIKYVDFELFQYHYSKAYQLLKDHKYLLESKEISTKLKNEYYYTEGYILMQLGDYEFAQKAYYKLLDYGEQEKDTFISIQALYSLGQLFESEKDYENSEKYFLRTSELEHAFFKEKEDYTQTYIELANLFFEKKDYEKASHYCQIGLDATSEHQHSLKLGFILIQGEIYIKKNKIISAHKAFDTAYQIALLSNGESDFEYCKEFQAKLFNAQGDHKKALNIYEKFIAEDDNESLFITLDWYDEAHKISNQLGDFQKAYNYKIKASAIKDSINSEKKMQQTAFLKIKFDSEHKEKENQILAAQVAQKNSQNRFLYAIASLFLFGLIVVFGALFQKRKYNKRLEKEVENRTKDLEHANNLLVSSNEELDQFNKILSHDLKEPLRSIVGFSTLAKKKISAESKIGEYLNIIGNSGKQLHQLIEDVNAFQRIGSDSDKKPEETNIQLLINTILDSISILLMENNAQIKYQNLPTIKTHKLFLFLVFKNLIENGLKYNESVIPIIEISYQKKNNTHLFLFKDNGIGIAPQFQDRVFGMFKRLNDRSTYSGSGMGLSISKKMMAKLNGTISIIESEEGKGSTFQVSIPMIETNQNDLEVKMSLAESN